MRIAITVALLASTLTAAEPSRPVTRVNLPNPRAVAVDRAGNLYVGEVSEGRVHRITPTGAVSLFASIVDPIGIFVARDQAVWVPDADANTIYKITPAGVMTVVAGPSPTPSDTSLSAPTSLAIDAAGNAYVTNNTGNAVLKLTPAGVASAFAGKRGEAGNVDGIGTAARFGRPRGIAIDAAGNLYVADETNSNIRKITQAGAVTTLAAQFAAPRALTVDANGNVFVADTDNHAIRKITPAGVVTTYAGKLGERGNADGPAADARFSEPRGISVDPSGTLFVADTGNHSLREISPSGLVRTIAQ